MSHPGHTNIEVGEETEYVVQFAVGLEQGGLPQWRNRATVLAVVPNHDPLSHLD